LVNQYPQDFDATIPVYSIGIHPWFIVEERLASDLDIVETKLQETNCLAVGECGLDKHCNSDRIATVGFRKTVGFGTKI
jgi:TatD DNase family protein